MTAPATPEVFVLNVPTRDGDFRARYSKEGLCGFEFPSGKRGGGSGVGADRTPREVRQWHALTIQAVGEVLAGREPRAMPPIHFASGTAFQKRVWETLRQIGCGQTMSYSQLARAIGRPKAVRAVGSACGANPVPVLVPCHRILAARQGLGGFSGGLRWKRLLLEREGSWPQAKLSL